MGRALMDFKDRKSKEPERTIARKVLEEGLRMAVMLGTLLSAVWLLGEPAATRFVEAVITNKHLVADSTVDFLKERVENNEGATRGIQGEVRDIGRDLDSLKASSKINQELLTEQRQDIKSILRSLREDNP
jgi:hypothetical protein